MIALLVLASEEITERTLWNPTLKGILVVAAAIGLFIGSIYLLLATDLGARLGFLVTAAALSGFMALLSALWLTSTDPLLSLRGRIAEWEGVEVVGEVSKASPEEVRVIETEGREVSQDDLAGVKAAAEQVLMDEESDLAQYSSTSDFLVLEAREIGGERKNVFWHEPLYAAVEICPADTEVLEVPFGDPAPEPLCQPGEGQTLVLLRDLGSIRQPAGIVFVTSLILFSLSLLGLHWREKDQRRAEREEQAAKTAAEEGTAAQPEQTKS